MNLITSALAQTITPVVTESAASGIPWYAWAGLAAAVAAIAYVVLKKKDPAALTVVTAAGSSVVSELTSLLHKAADTAKTTAATIQSQAAVIAAPAVHAAVNAPVAAVPAPVPTPAVLGTVTAAPQTFNLGAPMADPNGPPRSNNQSFPLDTGRGWWASPPGFNPPGYVYDLPWPPVSRTVAAPTATPDPTTGSGLLAVLTVVGNSQNFRNNASAKLQAVVGPAGPNTAYAALINAVGEADPTWNAALSQVLAGLDPQVAFNRSE